MRSWAFVALLALFSVDCRKKQDLVVPNTADKVLTGAQIDADPLALLPGSAIALFYVDAQKLFASEFGQKLVTLANARMPLPASAEFDAKRDLESAYIGSYSMQGADVVAVLKGTFKPDKIEAAASSTEQTPLGVPVVKSTYAERTLYTAQNIGFVVLTEHTVLAGNETALRRALDRVREGRVKRETPSFLDKLLSTPNSALVGGADFRSEPVSDSIRQQLPFMNGVETLQLVGNFEPPGVNVAGTLTYPDEAAAQRGAQAALSLRQTLQNYSFLMAIIGISQPVQKLEAEAKGKNTEFVLGLDGQAIARLLDKAEQLLGSTNRQPVPATLSSGVSR